MARWRTLVGVCAAGAFALACGDGSTGPTPAGPTPAVPTQTVPTQTAPTQSVPVGAVPVAAPSLPVEVAVAIVARWTEAATQAARNGPTVLVRFAVRSRAPGLSDDPDCLPPFAGALRDDPDALADAIVTARPDGTYRVRGSDVGIEVAIVAGRAVHLEGCGGPAGLLAEAEQERLAAIAAAEADAAREAAAREEAERVRLAAERRARAQAEAAMLGGDDRVPERTEVFPRDPAMRWSG